MVQYCAGPGGLLRLVRGPPGPGPAWRRGLSAGSFDPGHTAVAVPLREYIDKEGEKLRHAQATHEAHVLEIVSDYRSSLRELKQDLKAEVNVVRYELTVARSEFKNEASSMKFDMKELRNENSKLYAQHQKATNESLQTLGIDISSTLKKSLLEEVNQQNAATKTAVAELTEQLKADRAETKGALDKAGASEKEAWEALKEEIEEVRQAVKQESERLNTELTKAKGDHKTEAAELKTFIASVRAEQKAEMTEAIRASYYRTLVGVFAASAGGIACVQAIVFLMNGAGAATS